MTSPVRLSVMGAVLIGKRHVEDNLAWPETVLSSIVDPMPTARELAVFLNEGALSHTSSKDYSCFSQTALDTFMRLEAISRLTCLEKPARPSTGGRRVAAASRWCA